MPAKALEYIITGSRSDIPKDVLKRGSYHRPTLLPETHVRNVAPFEHEEEHCLLQQMLRSKDFYKPTGVDTVFGAEDKYQESVLFSEIKRGRLDDLIRFDQICWDWNIRFLVDAGEPVAFLDYVVKDASKIRGKEIVHFKNKLMQLARTSAMKLLPDAVQVMINTASLVSAEPRAEMTAVGPILDSPVEIDPSLISVQPASLPTVSPEQLNQSIPGPPPAVPRKRKASAASTSASSAAKRQSRQADDSDVACADCGKKRHVASSTCPFKIWSDMFTTIPREADEERCDARRRVWKLVRERFVRNGKFVVEDGWTYLGPPSV